MGEHNREILQKARHERKKKEAMCISKEPLSLQAIRRQNQQRQQHGGVESLGDKYQETLENPKKHPLLALCPPNKSIIRFAVQWALKVNESWRNGQHHYLNPLIHRHTADTKYVEPIHIRLSYPPVLYADSRRNVSINDQENNENHCLRLIENKCFQEQILENAILPVSAIIFNCQTDANLSLSFEALNEPMPGKKIKSRATLSPSFQWIGNTRHYISNLKPGCTAEVKLMVRFLRPGIFDINRFRLILLRGQKKVIKKVTYQFLVEVKSNGDTIGTNHVKSLPKSMIRTNEQRRGQEDDNKEEMNRKMSETMELLRDAEELLS